MKIKEYAVRNLLCLFIVTVFALMIVLAAGTLSAQPRCSISGSGAEEKAEDQQAENAEPKETDRYKNAENVIEKEYEDGAITKTEDVEYTRELNKEEL
ncbi:MAG: hypothetical protein ABIG55_04045 [Candidatus Omnitrophota bacterium]|nr:hypothetical protein [Candidatus Omnitrophota bacterium]